MRWRAVSLRTFFVVTLAVTLATWCSTAQSQQNQQNNTNVAGVSGIEVDPQGVVRKKTVVDTGGITARQRIAAQRATLGRDALASSKQRMISLTRLEKAIVQNSGVLTDEMRYLAGLQRVRYVFFYPQTKDIVIAGPAERWIDDGSGRIVGIQSGRAAVQLQDLVVALRAFPPGSEGVKVIGCSIDPTPEGLEALQQFLRSNPTTFQRGQEQAVAPRLVEGLRSSLGMQNVTVNGVPPKTHFAQVLVEADYRMKLIGIGLEQPPVRMTSFVERVNPSQVARNALFRWFFVPDYHCVRTSEDGLAMELVGDGVKLVGEDEMVAEGGKRVVSGRSNMASQAFVTSFTQKYPYLADRPVRGRGLHPEAGLLRQGRLEDGVLRQRAVHAHRGLQLAQASRIYRGHRMAWKPADDPHRRRRADRGPHGRQAGERARRRERQRGQAPPGNRLEARAGTVVVGLNKG
jgi:hypothetical protein